MTIERVGPVVMPKKIFEGRTRPEMQIKKDLSNTNIKNMTYPNDLHKWL